MSTFDGRLPEFPEIRIDFFRRHPDVQPPLACFLSHVHSDHLAGLESLKSPFVYCSAATKEILLRLERYPCRINYAKGILEARQQTFKHLSKVLKPLPLDTPTCLELRPGLEIQVTLFDANHCPGAVMFLIERPGMAILYTGDVRSEPWFVNSLMRNPNLIEYTSGIKTIDTIYLDTSFTRKVSFQTKADGVAELLRKVKFYPDDTVFHFQAWTFGYEEVWIALARALRTKVHVDDYKLKIYKSLRLSSHSELSSRFGVYQYLCPEAAALVGHMIGNTYQPGCLTSDPNVRIHSCEKGNMCSIARGSNVVRIQPVVAHVDDGHDLPEMGIGGGGDDLERGPELDMDNGSVEELLNIVQELGNGPAVADALRSVLGDVGNKLSLDMNLSSLDEHQSTTLEKAVQAIVVRIEASRHNELPMTTGPNRSLPKTVRFPYSRHSSYEELCHLVSAFKPRDVWPNTYNAQQWYEGNKSISSLFGLGCSGTAFRHDSITKVWADARRAEESLQRRPRHSQDSHKTSQGTLPPSIPYPSSPPEPVLEDGHTSTQSPTLSIMPRPPSEADEEPESMPLDVHMPDGLTSAGRIASPHPKVMIIDAHHPKKRTYLDLTVDHNENHNIEPEMNKRLHTDDTDTVLQDPASTPDVDEEHEDSQQSIQSYTSCLSDHHSIAKKEAYYNMLEYMQTGSRESSFELISTGSNHSFWEQEL